MSIRTSRLSILLRVSAAIALLSPLAASQTTMDTCGTLVPGVTCEKLFQPDAGGLYILETDLSSYSLGDHLHVVGSTIPGCLSFCMQGDGCIAVSLIEACTPAADLCYGDGSQGNCPCGNNGAPTRGCQNSAGTGGAKLTASGTVNPDTVVLSSAGERPTSLSLFVQGQGGLAVPVPFGDGLRCVASNLKRLYVRNAVSGVATAPQGNDPSITQRSASLGDPLSPGDLRHYFAYYRDPVATFCPMPQGDNFNVSSAISILW